jgi:hypothetical protein
MRRTRRLSLVALMAVLAVVGLAGERRATAEDHATAPVIAPPSEAAPLVPRETSITTRTLLASPWLDPDRSPDEPGQAERAKTFAWLLLLFREQRGVR